jgi:hypothetical protein
LRKLVSTSSIDFQNFIHPTETTSISESVATELIRLAGPDGLYN